MFKEINTLKPFLEEPNREFHVREAASLISLSPATASKKLKLFTKLKILKHRKERIYDLYKANLENNAFTDLKTYYTINKIRQSLIPALNKFYLKPTIVLFGSAAFGLDTKESDIDLLIISENIKDFPSKKKYQQKLNRNLQIFAHNALKQVKNKHLLNSMINGVVLQGEIEWI